MKVAILCPYPTFQFFSQLGLPSRSYDNNATWTVALASGLAKIPETDVHVITETDNLASSKTIIVDQASLHFIKVPGKFKTLTLWQYDRKRIRQVLDEIQPDIVHGQGIENQYGYTAVTSKWPHLLTIHGIPHLSNNAHRINPFSRERLVELLAASCLRNARHIVVINPFVEEVLGLRSERYRFFPIANAVGRQFFEAAPQARDAALILSIGYVYPLKGHDILLKAMAILRKRNVHAKVVIVGPLVQGNYVSDLQQFVDAEKLDVEFTGFLPPDEVLTLLQRCTMLVHVSRADTAPMALSEAMAVGTPVIGSRVGGIPYMIQEGQTGLLFESEKASELADKIQYLLQDGATRTRLGGNGHSYAYQTYHPDHVAGLTRAAYEEVLETKQGAVHRSFPVAAKPVQIAGAQATAAQEPPQSVSRVLKHAVQSSSLLTAAARRLLAMTPASLRLGRDFWQWYAFFNESEHWPEDRLVDYQMQQLRGLLAELARTSDFYRERLAGIKIESLRTLGEFRARVPALTRNEFRERYSTLRSRDWQRVPATKCQTSGTTGSALQFYHPVRDKGREWAAICHQWKRVGFDPARSRRVEFRGLTKDGKLVEVFPEQNMIRCSILHLHEQHVRYYAEQIRRHGMDFYHGYPSALYLLAQVICRRKLDFPQPQAVLLASEEVYDWQVAQLEAAFPQAKIFAHYGCAERTVLSGWCESRREYHVLPQYALVEIDPANSEIIGTNLFNTLNGFVRYRMSDTALKVESVPCPACGRAYLPRLSQLGGRMEEYLYSPQRGWIPPAIVTYCLKLLKAIHEVQIVQQKTNELTVRYTADTRAPQPALQTELASIVQGLRHLMGADMEIHFERVESFPRSATGKFQWIICQLKNARDPMEKAVLWKP